MYANKIVYDVLDTEMTTIDTIIRVLKTEQRKLFGNAFLKVSYVTPHILWTVKIEVPIMENCFGDKQNNLSAYLCM